jgi:FKBP-type peptidyl-prolyl cis-trans isomerase FkpA
LTISIKDFFKDIVKQPYTSDSLTRHLIFTYQFKAETDHDPGFFMTYQRNLFMKKQAEQVKKDSVAIEAYLLKNNITAQKTESGLYYSITRPGQGENGKSGQAAKVDYAGYTLDGVYFDTSIKAVAMEKGLYNPEREKFMPYGPYEFTIDRREVINGWDEALKVLNKGSKATIFVPFQWPMGLREKIRLSQMKCSFLSLK